MTEVTVPVMDETTESVTVAGWLVVEGSAVSNGETLCQVETDKATVDIETTVAGVLRRQLVKTGDVVPPLTVVALVGDPHEPLPTVDPFYRTRARSATPVLEKAQPVSASPTSASAPSVASPRARRLARELGVDLSKVSGTGRGGRIRDEDVVAATATAAVLPGEGWTKRRRAEADRVSRSWQTIPHFFMSTTVDMSRIAREKETSGPLVTYTDYIARAVIRALQGQPRLNAHWSENGPLLCEEIRLGIIVDTPTGLLIPTLPAATSLPTVQSLSRSRAALVENARAGRLASGASAEPTFTITNLGPGPVERFTAIISPPQVGILAIGSIAARPLVLDGLVVARPTVTLTLACDHRAVDGRIAAAFLSEVQEALETAAET